MTVGVVRNVATTTVDIVDAFAHVAPVLVVVIAWLLFSTASGVRERFR